MKIKTVAALEARRQFGRILEDVQGGRLRVLVEKSGVPMVGIISAQEFRQLITERGARFKVIDRLRRRPPSFSEREVQRDVREAVRHVRRGRRA